MMASGAIHKHTATDGRTTWRVRVDSVDDAGRRHQPQRTFPSKREAEQGLRAWLAAIDAGQAVTTTRRTVADYLAWWLDHCAAHRVKATTLASYRYLSTRYIVPALGALRLDTLNPQRLTTFYSHALEQGLSHRTVRYLHSILHTALAEAVRLQMLARNPTAAATPPRPVRTEAAAWSPEEAQRFLSAAQSDSLWPLWLLALHTGLRRSELLGLRWRDVELGDRGSALGASSSSLAPNAQRPTPRLVVRQSVVLVGNELRIQEGAKRGGHSLALSGVCVAALRAHRTAQAGRRLWLGPLWTDHDLVVTTDAGGPAHPTTVRRHFVALQEQAGVPPLPFHGLRHTHATILMLAGVHPKVVSERLGHADIGITLRTYSHVLPQMHQQAAEVFAAAVSNGTEHRAGP